MNEMSLAQRIAERFAQLPQVEAVSLTGSLNSGVADDESDIDLYIFVHAEVPVSERRAAATPYADGAEFDNRYWGTADSWHDRDTGIRIEAIYWWTDWIEDQVERVLHQHEASTGYSTAFLYSLNRGRILFDRNGWLHPLQAEAQQPYPDDLRRAIIAKNQPTLRNIHSSYLHQITAALKRDDLVSLNHRIAALLAGYFDELFAINRQMHPGEKRLLRYAEMLCPKRPPQMREQVEGLIKSTASGEVPARVNALIDGLDELLLAEGFDPAQT